MWKTTSGKLLFRDTESHIEIRENHQYRWMHFDSHHIQSAMNLKEPHALTLHYMTAMSQVLHFQAEPQSLLMLGLGGGGFVRYFHHLFPQMKLIVVEINPQVIELAQKYFQLPAISSSFEIIHEDAKIYLSQQKKPVDIILLDIYGRDHTPLIMHEQSFYDDCYRHLNEKGILAVNLVTLSMKEFLSIIQLIRKSFSSHTVCIAQEGQSNLIVFAFKNREYQQQINQLIESKKIKEALYDAEYGLCVG